MYNDHNPYKVHSGTPCKMGECKSECEWGECDQCISTPECSIDQWRIGVGGMLPTVPSMYSNVGLGGNVTQFPGKEGHLNYSYVHTVGILMKFCVRLMPLRFKKYAIMKIMTTKTMD